ncbi:MAG: hypothetical protein QOE28_1374 [Solirubrobacteraceae bacterium]|nr:hypothetical protein [Solirubrobacteraceae bacterium]
MHRLTLIVLAAVVLAAAPAGAFAQSGQTIPVPGPILTKIGSTPMVETWDGGGGLPYLGSSNSYNAGDWESNLRTYHDTGVYNQQIAKVDAVAVKWLSRAGRHTGRRFKLGRTSSGRMVVRPARASHGKGRSLGNRKPAIVFDVDETSLSNYTAIDADNFTFGPQSKAEATNEIGTAIAPTLSLFKLAQSKGIATFFITGRREDTRDHTASNLNREGFTNYTGLVLKPQTSTASTVDYKSGARQTIESQGYRIVASVGDQYSDLAGGHEDVAFKLPNPFYFLP